MLILKQRQTGLLLLCILALSRPCHAASGNYAVLVSDETIASTAWSSVVAALKTKHTNLDPFVLTWRESPHETLPSLRKSIPKYCCFVVQPHEATREFVASIHTLCRRLDGDEYCDTLWGILTGFDAANALDIAKTTTPLIVKQVTSGTEIAMDRVVEGEWYCERNKNLMVRKKCGEIAERMRAPDDTTALLAERLSGGHTDLFVTSGHATERGWQIGYSFKNGYFRSGMGKLWGEDTKKKTYPIESNNPKVWLPVGNCLAGHIDGPDALALAFMNAGGVRQMIGYTVPTWFGYAGWGVLDYFVEQPGRFSLCEAFHANNIALVQKLSNTSSVDERRGLTFDRDVVAFYGDPAWEARMAPGKLQFEQTFSFTPERYSLTVRPLSETTSFKPVNTNGSQRGYRPIVQFFPKRLKDIQIITGEIWNPVITDSFILVPLPASESTETIHIVFQGQTIRP